MLGKFLAPALKHRDSVVLAVLFALFIFILLSPGGERTGTENERPVVLPSPPVSEPAAVLQDPLNAPERVIIPKIGVNAAVQYVGTTAAGTMQAPTYYKDTAWFKLGPAPGENGNAVIAGHYDTQKGQPAVFRELEKLSAGDEVLVRNEKGKVLKFVVSESVLVDYENPPPEILARVFGPGSEPKLVLITCDGTWLPEEKTYSGRLIVFADFAGMVE